MNDACKAQTTRLDLKHWREPALVAAIMVGAAVLRMWGIKFGLPHRYHIDEPPYVLAALRIAQGDLAITYPFNSPNIFQLVLTLEYGLLFLVGRLIGIFTTPADVARLYQTDPSIFYLLARATSACFGTLTVGLAYLIGRGLYGVRGGAIATILLATAFIHVRDSHYAVTDALIALLVLTCLYFSIRHVRSGHLIILAAAGLAGGAAIGLKYLPAPILTAPLLSIVFRWRAAGTTRRWRSLIVSFVELSVATLAGFLLAFPALLFSPALFRQHIAQAVGQAANPLGNLAIDTLPAWLYYGRTLLWGLGAPLLIAIVGGIALALIRRSSEQAVLLMGIASYFVGISLVNTYFARYALPLVAPLIVLAAGFLVFCSDELCRGLHGRVQSLPISAVLVLIVAAYPATAALRHDYLLTQTDTRTMAKIWIEANLPEGTHVVTQLFGPPLSFGDDPEPNSARNYDVVALDPFVTESTRYTIDYYRNTGTDYIIVNSYNTNLRLTDNDTNGLRQHFYEALGAETTLIAEFSPDRSRTEQPFIFDEIYGPVVDLWQRNQPGPTLKIYQVRR